MGWFDKAKEWMTPERALAFQGIGMGLSQLDAGQPVNLSPVHEALNQRKEQAAMRKVLEVPGIMDSFTPQQQAVLASMPEGLATKIIMEQAFRSQEPVSLQTFTGPDGVVYKFNPITGETAPLTGAEQPDPGYRFLTPEELATMPNLDPNKAWQVGPDNRVVEVGGGGTSIDIDMGTDAGQYLYGTDAGVPAGWRVHRETGVASPIPGGPAEVEAAALEEKNANKNNQGQLKLGTTLESINLNIQEIDDGGLPVTGVMGDFRRTPVGRFFTGDEAVDFGNRTNQITDQAALAEVQNMRDNSPTGGAVGALTDDERRAIGNSVTALNNSTSPEEYKRAAIAYRKLALDIAYGEGTWELDESGQPVLSAKSSAPANDLGLSEDDLKYLEAP